MSAAAAIRAREASRKPKPAAKPKKSKAVPVVDEIAAVELPTVVE